MAMLENFNEDKRKNSIAQFSAFHTGWSIFPPIFILLFIFSCDTSVKTMRESSGGLNEIVIVCKNELWSDQLGHGVVKVMQENFHGLPQAEPTFSLSQVSPDKFGYLLQSSRSLLILEQSSENTISFQRDVIAQPQYMIVIKGTDKKNILSLLKEHKDSIFQTFENGTINYVKTNLKKRATKDANLQNQNIDILIPNDYRKVEDTNDFLWFRKGTTQGQMNVMIYITPIKNDLDYSSFNLIKHRDSILKIHVYGGAPGSYMQTEMRFPPNIQLQTWHDNELVYEMRGLWRMNGEFRGGPFLSYSWIDEKGNRIVTAEGFAYAPNMSKRNLMLKLEAILRSLKVGYTPSSMKIGELSHRIFSFIFVKIFKHSSATV